MRLLSFDPSSGSAGSMPALAFFLVDKKEVELVETVRLELDHRKKPHIRLNQLQDLLIQARRDYKPDAIAIEYIAPKIKRAVPVSLHRSVGVIQGVFGDLPYAEVRPQKWHSWLRREGASYVKDDELDAVLIGIAAIEEILKAEIGKELIDGIQKEDNQP